MGSHQEFSRADRVRKALIREIGDIITKDLRNPMLEDKVISVIDVELTKDLSYAKVFVSAMGDKAFQETVSIILDDETPRIRKEIGRRIRLRRTPELIFHLDDSFERGARVTEILDKISKGEDV